MPRLAPYNYLPESALTLIEANSERILEETGLLLKGDPQSLDLLASIGAKIEGERVRVPHGLLREIIQSSAPKQFTHHARNPACSMVIGSEYPVFAPIYGAPQYTGENKKRRLGTLRDYEDLVRLTQGLPAMNNSGHQLCVLDDVLPHERSLKMAKAHLEYSDKPFIGSILSPTDLEDVVTLTNSTFDKSQTDGVRLLHLINSIPPLTNPPNALACLRKAVELNQGVIVTSFMLMGCMAPCTPTGALAQGLAEVTVLAALAQICKPGAAMILGIYGLPFSMKKILPEFGDPVSWQMQLSAVPLLKRLGAPVLAYGALTSSNIDDAQSAYQSTLNLQVALHSGADFVLHAAGWLENGRQVGHSKFVRDAVDLQKSLSALGIMNQPNSKPAVQMVAAQRMAFETTYETLLRKVNSAFQ